MLAVFDILEPKMDNQGPGNNYGGYGGRNGYGGYGNGPGSGPGRGRGAGRDQGYGPGPGYDAGYGPGYGQGQGYGGRPEAPYGPNSPLPDSSGWFKSSWQPPAGFRRQSPMVSMGVGMPGQMPARLQGPGARMPQRGRGGMRPQRTQRKRRDKRKTIAALAVVLLVLIGGGFLIKVMTGGGDSTGTNTTKSAHDAAIDKANQLSNNGNYDQEAQALADFLQTNPAQDQADEANLRLAAAYTNAQQYDKAFDTYKIIYSSPSPQYHRAGLRGMGVISGLKNNKTAAVQYYNQLIQEYQAVGNSPRQLTAVREELAYIQGQP